ncbi:hypothetical protein DNTS_034565 [Danionella cerebrum]|uniref:Methyltransferase domain-containing protein n=1 Tax=Danionella cerebrum TaxID=2873325 RepID=A0A553R1C5_9TELE|nr:hypothetical protein DNTS_034565 [Danionella translucida]
MKLVDTVDLLDAAKAHSLAALGVCVQPEELLQSLRPMRADAIAESSDEASAPDEFMNCKKAHEVKAMSEFVSCLARFCRVNQVIDVGSGKGYLCSYLSMKYNLQVYGIDSSSTNTHGALERNRKLKRFSKAYRKQRASGNPIIHSKEEDTHHNTKSDSSKNLEKREEEGSSIAPTESGDVSAPDNTDENPVDPSDADSGSSFLSFLDVTEHLSPRVHPSQLTQEEKEKRKKENLERKAREGRGSDGDGNLFSPLTSYVTAETELRALITELENAILVGLHTCGDLGPSSLRMFRARPELHAVCSVGCCYHLLSEEFNPEGSGCVGDACGFPMSQYLKDQACFCGRNARMSACLALERVSSGGGLPMESLFYRAVLHVILRDHYDSFKSEKRVGNVYSKATSFVDYVRRALRKLGLDENKLSDPEIQSYHDLYSPRMDEMVAFNMLKVTLAPCIEGLILLDRLCYLKEQENVSHSALVQLFDPVQSPRCYAVVGIKESCM